MSIGDPLDNLEGESGDKKHHLFGNVRLVTERVRIPLPKSKVKWTNEEEAFPNLKLFLTEIGNCHYKFESSCFASNFENGFAEIRRSTKVVVKRNTLNCENRMHTI